jgi:modulator of FtsH protease
VGADELAAWSDFGVGVLGAAAALAGLLFVAVSINLERIVGYPALPARAAQTLVLLTTPLVVAILLLAPDQGRTALGVELVAAGVLAGAVLFPLNQRRSAQERVATVLLVRALPSALTAGGVLGAGISLLADGGGGLRWLVPAVIAAFLGGLMNAWVLLVEILR